MAEEDALFAFESGLQPSIALELRKAGNSKLSEALALAARVGSISSAAASAPGMSHGRSIPIHQMEFDGTPFSRLEQLERREQMERMVDERVESRLNAITSGMGAKTQTQRGYQQERSAGGPRGRFGNRPGSGTGSQQRLPAIPGVPAQVVEQRRAANQCYRCGSADHNRFDCPNAVSAIASQTN